MTTAERLDHASSFFFFLGFVVSQLQHSPFALLAALANIGALFCYSIGYGLWLCACQMYPNYPCQTDRWYGFTEIKNQHRVAAATGAIAMLCCVAGIFIPPFLVAASWLFFISNFIWSIAEYHKQRVSKMDSNHSPIQESYIQYTILSTLMTLAPAVSATISLFFPPATLLAFVISSTLVLSLGSIALYCWLDHTLVANENDSKESYKVLEQHFSLTPTPSVSNTLCDEIAESPLWRAPTSSPVPEELNNEINAQTYYKR
ncbi:hypothetical protein [Legionella cardiaca]|uniref:Uncharacterized protein n=1 Tax=Legionella cardiaca TaxID=1071983 RepID=A0ABY8ATY3_9GAMM|nr:hypothetical protein [Legionella cardiaca]WED44135.1 hypothetical protein PXX05_04940 [Legionella cardiaca]